MKRRALACLLLAAAVALAPQTARALINLKVTVTNLVRDSSAVVVLRMAPPRDGKITGEVLETLAGEKPADKTITFDFTQAEDLPDEKIVAAQKAGEGLAVMCVFKRKQDGARIGALEIGTTWLGLKQDPGEPWKLDRDPRDLETVWGGSAKRLVPAIRYAIKEPGADFPVASTLAWARDQLAGTFSKPVNGCTIMQLPGTGTCVVWLGPGGDAAWHVQPGKTVRNCTEELGIASTSRALAAGDFTGDGRMDLASWNGTQVTLQLGKEKGFAPPAAGIDLPACRSLLAVSGGLVAGAEDGLTWLSADAKGALTARKLPGAGGKEVLGPGGVCVAADFNDDGHPDIAQFFAKGIVFYAGTDKPGVFAAPVATTLAVSKEPLAALCGDFDGDGLLDVLVAGDGGTSMFTRDAKGAWESMMDQTGELAAASGLGQGETTAVAASLVDVNGDTRQGLAVFSRAGAPSVFFNRGFGAFGIARTMVLGETSLKAARNLGAGTPAGTVWDVDGDGTPDLLAADTEHNGWVVYAKTTRPRPATVTLLPPADATGPHTVFVLSGDRPLAACVVAPGQPAAFCLPKEGAAVTLRWRRADGKLVQKEARGGPVELRD